MKSCEWVEGRWAMGVGTYGDSIMSRRGTEEQELIELQSYETVCGPLICSQNLDIYLSFVRLTK